MDLFLGMGKEFVKDAMDISTKLYHADGDYLFHQGGQASHFYIVLKGKVRLSLAKPGSITYAEKHPSEVIGFSSLISRGVYSVSAECVEPTNLLRFNRERFLAILRKNSDNEAILFNRLIEDKAKALYRTPF
jgi:CRP-like cAMP-binding protein